MSPEHLKKLRELSEVFEQGVAGHEQIRQLNEILTQVNTSQPESPYFQQSELNSHKRITLL